MDQDFHYYGTYYAAREGGFDKDDATLVAKAANFIDFFSEETYASYWQLVSDTQKSDSYNVVAKMDYPRYTFQGSLFGSGVAPEDGLWCSYHFTPGNYADPAGTPSREAVHGKEVANLLPPFETRNTEGGRGILTKYNPTMVGDLKYGKLLNRPQSALSRNMIVDAIKCATDDSRLEAILRCAAGGEHILSTNKEDNLKRFRLILLGVRAHVIADTWAHQDFCGLSNVLNTYWDVNYDPESWNPAKMGYGRQSIDYDDGSGWKNTVLSAWSKLGNPNFEAAPNGTSYLGHGWMGHMPDFSFIKFRYKPCWANPSEAAIERDNPSQYKAAWVELASLFAQANGKGQLQLTDAFKNQLAKANAAIQAPCNLGDDDPGREESAKAWKANFGDLPATQINVVAEPDKPAAVLDGMIQISDSSHRYGTSVVNACSDLYLFQIAADYQFHFVKHFLKQHDIYSFTGSWSQQTSTLSSEINTLFSS